MEFAVIKTGSVMLDAAHAYGLQLLLSFASQAPVELKDGGGYFELRSGQIARQVEPAECIRQLLEIPSAEILRSSKDELASASLAVRILEGLFAILFTSRGLRVVSVRDVIARECVNQAAQEQSLEKVGQAIEMWIKVATWIAQRQLDWMSELLSAYRPDRPTIPEPVVKRTKEISIPMTIDPTFSYSTRRPNSDGKIVKKSNISFSAPPYMALLAIIGAARFLRAHRVAGNIVMFYLPIAESITISVDVALPILKPSMQPVDRTLLQHWIDRSWNRAVPGGCWSGLAYQVMQTQGAQQSISRGCGYLDYAWLEAVERQAGSSVTSRWSKLLRLRQQEIPFEFDNLTDSLLHRHIASWTAHLLDVARQPYNAQGLPYSYYHLQEVKEITKTMSESMTSPLLAVLEREQGTRKFGYALRQLGRYNRVLLRDVIDDLDQARDLVALLGVLRRAVQECSLALAKTPFIRIPDDQDFGYLLDDIERFGVHTIAALLTILSVLRYTRMEDEKSEEV